MIAPSPSVWEHRARFAEPKSESFGIHLSLRAALRRTLGELRSRYVACAGS